MNYTLWSHGRLLGETDLAFARCFEKHRMGWFYPNDLGERLMPIICGVKPALFALGDLTHRLVPNPYAAERRTWDLETVLRTSTEFADLAAAQAQEEGLALELRGPTGKVIPTERIGIQDVVYLQSLAFDNRITLYDVEAGMTGDPELDEEMQAELDELMDELSASEAWQSREDEEDAEDDPNAPRYQIMVELIDAADVP
jgi:hypothetical protein